MRFQARIRKNSVCYHQSKGEGPWSGGVLAFEAYPCGHLILSPRKGTGQEVERLGCGRGTCWQEGLGLLPWEKQVPFPRECQTELDVGHGLLCTARTTGTMKCWEWGRPPSLHPCSGLLRETQSFNGNCTSTIFIAFLRIGLFSSKNVGSTGL